MLYKKIQDKTKQKQKNNTTPKIKRKKIGHFQGYLDPLGS